MPHTASVAALLAALGEDVVLTGTALAGRRLNEVLPPKGLKTAA